MKQVAEVSEKLSWKLEALDKAFELGLKENNPFAQLVAHVMGT